MPPAPVVSPVAYVVLLISCANLVFVVIAFFSDGNSADIVPSVPKMASSQTLALGLLFVSQLLFLALNIIGLFQWHRFTVGDPVTVVAALCGASLSVGSLAVGPLGAGFARFVRLFVAIWLSVLWILSYLATVTV